MVEDASGYSVVQVCPQSCDDVHPSHWKVLWRVLAEGTGEGEVTVVVHLRNRKRRFSKRSSGAEPSPDHERVGSTASSFKRIIDVCLD